ncbi:hypothetical protein PAXINDRAFT_152773 [Paxillus involutus ATCC 200175]|nr:hypothetical protein PAXINDRAFT_152773 [Paxillus involutus ATCC 200175]
MPPIYEKVGPPIGARKNASKTNPPRCAKSNHQVLNMTNDSSTIDLAQDPGSIDATGPSHLSTRSQVRAQAEAVQEPRQCPKPCLSCSSSLNLPKDEAFNHYADSRCMKQFKIKGTSRILYQAEALQQLRESKISMDDLVEVKGAIEGSDDEEPLNPSQLTVEDTDGMIMDDLIKVKGTIEGSDDGTGDDEEPPNPSQLTAKDTDSTGWQILVFIPDPAELPYVSQIPLRTRHAEHEDEEPQDPSQLPPHTHNGDDEGGELEAAALLNLDQEDEDGKHILTEGTDGENEGSNDNQSDWEADDRACKERAKNKHAQLGSSPPSASGTEASNGGGSCLHAKSGGTWRMHSNNYHCGHFPGEGMQKAVELGECTVAEADKIAKECSKQRSTILKLAGLSGSSARSTSDWNCYQVWYASKHPKNEDVDAITYRQQMKAHFNEHKDEEQFPEIWEEVHKHALLRLADTTDLKPAQVHNLIMKVQDEFKAVGILTNQKANFSWIHTLNIMWKHRVWVVDWPAKVVPLGPGFSTNGKGVTSKMLDAICMPLLRGRMDKVHYRHEELCLIRKTVTKGKGKAKGKGKGKEKEKEISDIPIPDTEFEIVPWSDKHKKWADKQDLRMLHIPLVIDTDGTTLQYLRDSTDFLSMLPKDFEMPDDPRSPSVDQSPPAPIYRHHPHCYSHTGMPGSLQSMSLVTTIAIECFSLLLITELSSALGK